MDESRSSIRTGVIPPLTTADYVLFAFTLVVSAVVGIYYAIRDRNRQTTDEFLLGGKSMSVFPVAMSLMVTFISALTLLGNPAEIYNYNTMFSWLAVSFIFAIAGAAYLFVPFFYRLEVLSTFEVSAFLSFCKHQSVCKSVSLSLCSRSRALCVCVCVCVCVCACVRACVRASARDHV